MTAPSTPTTRRTMSARPSPIGMTSRTVTRAGLGGVRRLQRGTVADVAAGAHRRAVRRSQQPAAVLRTAEQGGEAGGGVEAGQAQPVDRAVLADQGRRPGVAEHGVVLDRQRHGTHASRAAGPRIRGEALFRWSSSSGSFPAPVALPHSSSTDLHATSERAVARGDLPPAARRGAARPADAPGPHPAPGLRRRAGQPGLHLRDRAGAEGGVLRAARLDLLGSRRAALGDPVRGQRRGRARGGRPGDGRWTRSAWTRPPCAVARPGGPRSGDVVASAA